MDLFPSSSEGKETAILLRPSESANLSYWTFFLRDPTQYESPAPQVT
jgi:hypothetical protein